MKHLLLLATLFFTLALTAQEYTAQWEKILRLEQDGEIKKASAETEKLYILAKKDKNEPQVIRIFFFRSKYLQMLTEDAQVTIINNLKKEIATASIPGKAILESLYAEMLQDIYTHDSYRINQRTNTNESASENFETWTRSNFETEILLAYNRSLQNRDVLYKTPLKAYAPIVDFNPALAKVNRSLYDFLAERYINADIDNYTSDNESYLTPQYPILFGTPAQFATYKAHDSLSPEVKQRLEFSVNLEKFYTSKKDSLSLQQAILQRLSFVNKSVYNDNDTSEIYINTLQQLSGKWGSSPFAYRAKLQIAQLYNELANEKTHPDYKIKAVALCNDIIAHAGTNDAAFEALGLKNSITAYNVRVEVQKFVMPNKPLLTRITYSNADSVTVYIYKAGTKDLKAFPNAQAPEAFLKERKPYLEKKYALTNKKDYFTYTTEVILPPLPQGSYIIAASIQGNAQPQSYATLQAVYTTLLKAETSNAVYQVLNLEDGKPVKGAKLVYGKQQLFSGDDGMITLPAYNGDFKYEMALITYKGDTLADGFRHTARATVTTENPFTAGAQLYTDRAIYRPGQTVFFKAIITQLKNGVVSTVPNQYFSVSVKDDNDKELKTFRLQTNDFGSFTAQFALPANLLTGDISIYVLNDKEYDIVRDTNAFWDKVKFSTGLTTFKVEEYKRPTFDITFNTVKNDIKINQNAKVTGKAMAFSGAPLQNAKVTYRIKRESRMTRYNFYDSNYDEIAQGDTITNATGNFEIRFLAKPDTKLDPKGLPLFTYTIMADVTDANGETHSSRQVVYGGYHSLALSVSTPDVVNTKKGAAIDIASQNLNSQPKPTQGQVTVYKVKENTRVYADRPWLNPEIQNISREEFEKNFPYLPYILTQRDTVEHQKTVLTQTINTANVKTIDLKNFDGWDSGHYEVVFTAKDSANNTIEEKAQFLLKRDTDTALPGAAAFVFERTNTNYKEDGYISYTLQSSLPLLYVNVQAENRGTTVYKALVKLKNGRANIKIPIAKTFKDGVAIGFDYVWQNCYRRHTDNISLAEAPKVLTIESQAIANKLLPGSQQTWSFTVKDSNTTPAEVLASMYDASLDKFAKGYWSNVTPPPPPYVSNYLPYKNLYTTGNASIQLWEQTVNHFTNYLHDQIFTYGFNFSGRYFPNYHPIKRQLPNSRELTLTGTVTNTKGQPLQWVIVTISGTYEGMLTNFDGTYTVYASKGTTVTFSVEGMISQAVTIQASATVNITLNPDPTILEEITVEGYRSTSNVKSNIEEVLVTGAGVQSQVSRSPRLIEGRGDYDRDGVGDSISGWSDQNSGMSPGSSNATVILRGLGSLNGNLDPLYVIDGVPMSLDAFRRINGDDISEVSVLKDAAATSVYGNRGNNGVVVVKTKKGAKEMEALQQVKARKNFNETAFFYPQLTTDKNGALSFSFTTPEALTEWKLRLLAHNKTAASAYLEKTFFTQKDLMVVPNMPRFLRESDTITLTAKVTNMTGEPKTGNALLQLFDAVTMQPVDAQMLNTANIKPFTIAAKGSTTISWTIAVPVGLQGVQYKVLAKASDFTDGEENILPVLTNTMLVTESLPLWVKPNTTKSYTFTNLKNNTSTTLRNQGITLEYTSNPAWVALQSLPYLMEYEHECAEQVFSRYYANAIAAHIINSSPKIAEVFAAWRKADKPVSKLEQNEELKSVILAESPWLLDAQSEEEKKNRMATLFELDKMKQNLEANLDKVSKKQSASGAFPWFDGGKDNEYITRHILAGFGHLNKLGIASSENVNALTKKGIAYLDNEFLTEYEAFLKNHKKNEVFRIAYPYSTLHYLYTRSFYLKQYPPNTLLSTAVKQYLAQIKMHWQEYSLYEKGMAALALNRFGDLATAKKIINGLKQTSALNEENGMYWIENKAGWYWYRAPIETQALLIEAFAEVTNDTESVDAMKVWVIKQKQNKNWPTTKSTSEAVYALLMQGTNWLSVKENTTFKLGDQKVFDTKLAESDKEAGTGYIKLNWKPDEITKDMATLTVENKSAMPGFGGFYWQYFEDLDKIKPAQDGIMNIAKELYLKKNTPDGPQLQRVTIASPLQIGDLVTIRLVLTIKEDVEYVHLKDMRASAFEPVDVLSKYEYHDGLSYYRSTRDAATHFFFDNINKGTYVLEYDVRVNNAGEFSNGITTLQSMYAPEFSGHTKGVRVKTVE